MRRREFIAGLAGAGLPISWPCEVFAQQPGRPLTIGFLGATTPSAQRQWTDAFVQRLRELDWIEGRSIVIDYRWANGLTDHVDDVFADFVQVKVDVIVTHSVPLTLAAKRATPLIPIVFAVAADPIGTGLVISLARPGGNVTGMSLQLSDWTCPVFVDG
jgi:putative tryptophan/tyrosine transport system substrate-binding protein